MMNLRPVVSAAWVMLAALLVLAQGVPGQRVLAQGVSPPFGAYDGPWAIDVRTATGPCGTGFAGEYSITGGRIAGRFRQGDRTQDVTGAVGPDGAFRMEIGGAGGIVLTGQLRWRVGWGEWEGPSCTGTFMTNRR